MYSTQDFEFDRLEGLKSIPAAHGIPRTILLSRLSFAGAIVSWAAVGVVSNFSWVYFCGLVVIGLALMAEHWLISDMDAGGRSKNISAAFFNVNASVSVIYFLFVLGERFLGK